MQPVAAALGLIAVFFIATSLLARSSGASPRTTKVWTWALLIAAALLFALAWALQLRVI